MFIKINALKSSFSAFITYKKLKRDNGCPLARYFLAFCR